MRLYQFLAAVLIAAAPLSAGVTDGSEWTLGDTTVTVDVAVTSPIHGTYGVTYTDGTGSSTQTPATPDIGGSGVESAGERTTNDGGTPAVQGGTYRIKGGKVQTKNSKGKWQNMHRSRRGSTSLDEDGVGTLPYVLIGCVAVEEEVWAA